MNKLKDLRLVAKKYGIKEKQLYFYGGCIAKVENDNKEKKGKLVLVSAMTSNKFGIGKTTVSIGLADALNQLKTKTILALREPSMGPVFGIKGGATGGGKSTLYPSDDINLHFTGDFHAIAQANNLLASIIDNHIFQGNSLKIDTKKVFFKRCLDINDRSLREISYKINEKNVETGFCITAASEVMAIMCLSENLADLKRNLGNILIGLNEEGAPVFARDLHAEEAMTIVLKDAFKPNLVQTMEGTPALVHLGPFANIAHGCNSIVATNFALTHADVCVTEAGFGSDLGAEKFLDIKVDILKKNPDAVVLVIVLKVIKEHGDGSLEKGFENVKKHIEILRDVFGVSLVVAINKHSDDKLEELVTLVELCKQQGVMVEICNPFEDGGTGCLELAKKVTQLFQVQNSYQRCYQLKDDLKTKISKIAKDIYGAKKVVFSEKAKSKLELADTFQNFYVNIAKTQFSISDKKDLLGCPKNFVFNVSDIEIRSGAKMIVVIAGNIVLMPGLAKKSNYLSMKLTSDGKIEGLF